MNKSVKTIAIIFTSLDIGGIERKIVDLSTHYSTKKNIQLLILLKHHQGAFIYQIPHNVKVLGFTKKHSSFINLFFPLWIWQKLLIHRPNLILSFGNFSSICTIIANLFSINTKVIISEDSSIDKQISQDSFSFIRSLLIRLTYPLASGIIVLTPTAFEKISNYTPSHKVTILPNWLPINIPHSKPITSRLIDILFIGRLVSQKDPLRFLSICKIVQSRIPKLNITMIGDGVLKSQVVSYIKKHKLSVTLLPSTTPVQPYYQNAKVFVLSSQHEGFPLTILESFYYLCPAICLYLNEVTPFYKNEPSKFLYKDTKTAVKLILDAIQKPQILHSSVKKYHDLVVKTRDQNFCDTLDYLQQFL